MCLIRRIILCCLGMLAWLGVACATLPATAILEVRAGGSDTNGGGFNPARSASGVDRSQQDAPHVVIDGATITGTVAATTTRLELVGHTAVDADLGNYVQIASGATAGYYEIVAVGSNYWQFDRACGTAGQSAVAKMGGAFGSPGATIAPAVALNIVYVKSGTYTLSTSTPGAGGPISTTLYILIEGYNSTRGDLGTKPVISAGAQTGITIVTAGGSSAQGVTIINLAVDGNNGTDNIGFNVFAGRASAYNCSAINCTTGYAGSALGTIVKSYAESCTTGYTNGARKSVAKSCTTGFSSTQTAFSDCLAISCTTGFTTTAQGQNFSNCTSYGASGDGFSGSGPVTYVNCLAVSSGGYGFGATGLSRLLTCANYAATSGATNGTPFVNKGFITLTADPFVNAAGGDFRLNATAGGGAALRSLGIGIYGQTDSRDIGAVQHTDPAGSGGRSRINGGRAR